MKRVLTTLMIFMGCLAIIPAQSGPFSADVPVYVQFNPAAPTLQDGTFDVEVYADLTGITGASSVDAALGGFAIPIAFDYSRVTLQSVTPGSTGPFAGVDFVNTDIDRANARGFVTVVNTHTESGTPTGIVHVATLTFQIEQAGKVLFNVNSARTIHEGSLASTYDAVNGGPAEIGYIGDDRVTLDIGMGTGSYHLIYPVFYSLETVFQGVSVVNEDEAADADVTFRAYDPTGQLIPGIDNPPDIGGPVQPLHQYVNAVQFLFNVGATQIENGWIDVESLQPNISGFFLMQHLDGGTVDKMDGADANHMSSSQLIMPLLGTEATGEAKIYIVNPGDQALTGTLRYRASDGTIVDAETVAIALQPYGVQDATFSGITKLAEDGYFSVEMDSGNVIAFEKYETPDYMAAINAQDVVTPSNLLYDAHFASGGQFWYTEFNIINPNDESADVTFQPSLTTEGTPIGQAATRTIDAHHHLRVKGYELFGFDTPQTNTDLIIGSVAVESDMGLLGSVTFGDTNNSQFVASLPLLSTASAKREIFLDHVAVGESGGINYFTGIAFVNPSSTRTATIYIELYAADGSLTADNSADPYTLDPGEHIAQMISDFLPTFSGTQIAGFIRVRSDIEVFSFMLFGDTGGVFLSAVPVR